MVAVLPIGPLSLATSVARSLRFLRSRRSAFLDSLNLNALVAFAASDTFPLPSFSLRAAALALPATRLNEPFSA